MQIWLLAHKVSDMTFVSRLWLKLIPASNTDISVPLLCGDLPNSSSSPSFYCARYVTMFDTTLP